MVVITITVHITVKVCNYSLLFDSKQKLEFKISEAQISYPCDSHLQWSACDGRERTGEMAILDKKKE